MEMLISGCLMFVLGSIVATCFWISFMKARDEGYNRGYSQACYEQAEREKAQKAAQPTLFGRPMSVSIIMPEEESWCD